MKNICTIVVIVLLFVGLAPKASATCTDPNSILNATYGWQGESLLAAVNTPKPKKIGNFIPLVQVGQLTFDGNGNFSGAHDTSDGSGVGPHDDSGTYSVNSDCTTGTISFATGIGFIMSFVITNGGQEIKYVSAKTGGVNSGTLRPVAAPACSASTVSGNSYGYATHGLVAHPARVSRLIDRFTPIANAGQISFEADGSVSGLDNVNLGGVAIPSRPIVGTYSVNSDCTGTTTMTIAGVDSSLHFVILQGGDRIIFLAIPSGFVWGGTLTKD